MGCSTCGQKYPFSKRSNGTLTPSSSGRATTTNTVTSSPSRPTVSYRRTRGVRIAPQPVSVKVPDEKKEQ